MLGDTQLRYLNLGLLGNADKSTHLAWRLALRAGVGDYTVFVDAHTGAILFQDLRSKDGYDLDLENGNNEQLKDLCGIFDNDNISANFDGDARATSDNIGRTYSFWRNTFGRDSYDDDGEQIEYNIHVRYPDSNGNTSANASYSPGCDIFGASNGMVTQDILAHEFTHAVVHNELGLPYQQPTRCAGREPGGHIRRVRRRRQLDDRRRLPAWHPAHHEQPTCQRQPGSDVEFRDLAQYVCGRLGRRSQQQRHPQQGRVPDH